MSYSTRTFSSLLPRLLAITAAVALCCSSLLAQQTLGGPAPTETCGALGDNDAGIPLLDDDAGNVIPCNQLLSNQ